jgi:hypothetical protein
MAQMGTCNYIVFQLVTENFPPNPLKTQEALLRQLREDLIGQQIERLGDDRLIRRGVVCRDKPFDWASYRVPRIELAAHSN